MPIRPEMRERYPKGWHEISQRIRFERAQGRCECKGECGIEHANDVSLYDFDGRCEAQHGKSHPVTGSNVVLTTAHYPDHSPENCADDNLLAMCQRCHLALDKLSHAITRRETRDRARGQGGLFDERALAEAQP